MPVKANIDAADAGLSLRIFALANGAMRSLQMIATLRTLARQIANALTERGTGSLPVSECAISQLNVRYAFALRAGSAKGDCRVYKTLPLLYQSLLHAYPSNAQIS